MLGIEEFIRDTDITIEGQKYIIRTKRFGNYIAKTSMNSQEGKIMTVFLENIGEYLSANQILKQTNLDLNPRIKQFNRLINDALNRFDLSEFFQSLRTDGKPVTYCLEYKFGRI